MSRDGPRFADWTARRRWFDGTVNRALEETGCHPGQHAEALLVELEDVFCVGAWLSVVIMATAVIEAHLREMRGSGDPMENTRDLFDRVGLPAEFEELRLLRNRIVHVHASGGEDADGSDARQRPALSADMHWSHADLFEADARDAVRLVALALTR